MNTAGIDLLGSIEGMEAPNVDAMTSRLEQVVAQNPGDVRSLLLLGNGYYLQGRIKLALETFNKAVALDPKNAYAHYYIGICHYRSAHIQEAIEALSKVTAMAPSMVMAYYWLGIAYFHHGRYDDARKAYETLLEKNHESHITHYHTAVICMVARDYEAARKHLQELVNLGSHDPQVFLRLGNCFYQLRKISEAIDTYRQGLKFNSDNRPLKEALASLTDVQMP